MNIKLGTGLLSEASKAVASNKFHTEYIPLDKLLPFDEEHGFSLDGIEELAVSIKEVGLQQNLVVEELPNGFYKILTGRRRYYACQSLVAQGYEEYKYVPCVVIKIADIDLPVNDDIKRTYAILTTNSEQRKLTSADRVEMIRKAERVYNALAEAGVRPKGRKRDYIAATVGISSATVGQYTYIEKNADQEIKSDLAEGKKSLRSSINQTQKARCTDVGTSFAKREYELHKENIVTHLNFEDNYLLTADELNQALYYIGQIEARYRKLYKLLHSVKQK